VSGPSSDQVTQAKAICAGWPVRRQYPAFALDTRQNHGVWGAMTEKRSAAHGQPRRARGPDPRALVDHMRGSAAVAIGAALAVAIVISGPHNCAGAPRRRPPGRQLTLAADCAGTYEVVARFLAAAVLRLNCGCSSTASSPATSVIGFPSPSVNTTT